MNYSTETYCRYADLIEDHNNLHKNFSHRDYEELKRMFSFSGTNGANVSKPDLNESQVIYNWHDKIILIAEDEDTNYLFLKAALSKTNALVIRAKDGQEAVDAVKANPEIDLVLMDIKMPVMNGVDATKIIRASNNKMVIIAQTAYVTENDRQTFIKAGCNDFLAKPLTRDKLLRILAQYL